MHGIRQQPSTHSKIAPFVDGAGTDPSTRPYNALHFRDELLGILKVLKDPVGDDDVHTGVRQRKGMTGTSDMPLVKVGMVQYAIVNIRSNDPRDLSLKFLKLFREAGIRHVELTSSSGAKVQECRFRGEESVDSHKELNCSIIARITARRAL